MTDRSDSSRGDIAAAARALGVNPNTVRTWLAQGGLASLDPADVEAMRALLHDDEEPAPPPPVQRSRARTSIPGWQRSIVVADEEIAPGVLRAPIVRGVWEQP